MLRKKSEPAFVLSDRLVGDVTILDLRGRLTQGAGACQFRDVIRDILAKGRKKVLLNLSDLIYYDSTGSGELAAAYSLVHNQGGTLKLFGVGGKVRGLLMAQKLLTVFESLHSEKDALRSFGVSTIYCLCPVCRHPSWPTLLDEHGPWPPQSCGSCSSQFEVRSSEDLPRQVVVETLRLQTYVNEHVEVLSGSPFTVEIVGRLDLFASSALEKAWKALPPPRRVLFDLHRATEISDAGRDALLALLANSEEEARAAISVEGLGQEQILGGRSLFGMKAFPIEPPVYSSRASALAALGDVSDTPAWRIKVGREAVEAKVSASAEPEGLEAKVPPAAPQPPHSRSQPLPKPKPVTPSPAATLVGAAVIVIVAMLAWMYKVERENQARVIPRAGTVRENPKDGLKYVWIPPGTFQMGCSPGDGGCAAKEKPFHAVTISKGFWIGQTEVTVGAYKRFATDTTGKMPPAPNFNSGWANESMPIVNLSWKDAHDYCSWAGGRLPTEAEWEYAARGGSAKPRYGDIDEVAWYDGNSRGQTHEVAQKRANAFGLYDALGNVWEWVNDWYDENYYQHSPSQDPSGPTSGEKRVLRGGSWYGDPRGVRVSLRGWGSPDYWDNVVGVRCALEVDSP
jgi:anti-anti-sigma factor